MLARRFILINSIGGQSPLAGLTRIFPVLQINTWKKRQLHSTMLKYAITKSLIVAVRWLSGRWPDAVLTIFGEGTLPHMTRHYQTHILMKRSTVKASEIFNRKKRSKVIEWETRETSRGPKNVQVDVTAPHAPSSRMKATQDTIRIKKNKSMVHKSTCPSMDVEDTLWTEEPARSEKKRVSVNPHVLPHQY